MLLFQPTTMVVEHELVNIPLCKATPFCEGPTKPVRDRAKHPTAPPSDLQTCPSVSLALAFQPRNSQNRPAPRRAKLHAVFTGCNPLLVF
jgi:hypothetical protein